MHSCTRALSRSLGALLIALVAAVLLGLLTGPAAAAAERPDVDVVAHRGSSGYAPENTLASVRLALRQGADVIENDIQRTSDGALVIMHDTSLARTTDVEQVFPGRAPWHVGTFTLAEIKQLDAGIWFGSKYAGQRVPTLAEWVQAVGSQAAMLLETKTPALYPGIEVDIDKELRALPEFTKALAQGRVVMQSFDHAWLRAYDQYAVDVPVGLLFAGGPPSEAQLADAATWAEQANPALGDMTEATVDQIHSYGLETHVWTVNDGGGMRRAIEWGVDGVITNYPQILREVLRDW